MRKTKKAKKTKRQRAQEIANDILDAFKNGTIPKALAHVFIRRGEDCPSAKWSWNNRLLVALRGHVDARGYRQWQKVGRQVKKGEKAIYIFGPNQITTIEERETADGVEQIEEHRILYFPIPVFGYEQTEGDPLPGEEDAATFIETLPLIEVARSWGLDVMTYAGAGSARRGFYRRGEKIGLGVENLSTWAHELVHAADDRLGTLNPSGGQQLDNEVVAEFGGAILLECLGYETESDRGGAFEYIEGYAKAHKRHVSGVCTEFLERTCHCVALLLDTAAEHTASGELDKQRANAA